MDIDKLAEIMGIIFNNCSECPLSKLCSEKCGKCNDIWKYFFQNKVKIDGIEDE